MYVLNEHTTRYIYTCTIVLTSFLPLTIKVSVSVKAKKIKHKSFQL